MSEELKLISQIENMIYVIRGQRVMMDSDLANLYGVELKRLNEQVRRNSERFPNDFMFECNLDELQDLRSQNATANSLNTWNHMRRSPPLLFTELGVAMLSSVLNSKQAVAIQRLDDLEEKTTPLISKDRKRIGLK